MTGSVQSRMGASLPMLNQPYQRYAEFAALAEDAGFDSVWDYEFYRNPFITHALKRLLAEGPAALATAASDQLVRAFAIAGTPDVAAEQLAAYDGVLPHIVLHTPYVPPIDQASSEDAFRSMVRVFARANV